MGDVEINKQKLPYSHHHCFRERVGQMMCWIFSNSRWLIHLKAYLFHLVTRFYGAILFIGNKYIANIL